jgi:hypothetical protein
VDEFVNERAGRSLAHVFTLLSLVLPAAPLQIAYQAVHATDGRLKGTALEYLEKVLPPDVSVRLLPFVNGTPGAVRTSRSREEIIAELLGSQAKHLEDLGRREPT